MAPGHGERHPSGAMEGILGEHMVDERGIAVVGSGYVGTVMAACLADLGHHVIGVEINKDKVVSLNGGTAPFFEVGLDERLQSGLRQGLLEFTDDYQYAMDNSEIVFLCVDTPPGTNGHPDMTSVASAARSIGAALRDGQAALHFNGKIEAVTLEQVRDAFQRRVQPDRMLTLLVGGS